MSKLLRLPFALLAVLALFLLSPGIAAADDPPTAEQCAEDPGLEGCPPADGGIVDGAEEVPAPVDEVLPPPDDTGPIEQPGSSPVEQPARDRATPAFTGAELGELEAEPPLICESAPTFPGCPDAPGEPGAPLTCEELATLLQLPEGCPENFTCEDLAALLGITCPEGPPSCEALAEAFGLPADRCPAEPPGDCEEFAALLGIEEGCEGIPCFDASQFPEQPPAELQPLLDALEQIGITVCEAEETPPTSGGNNGGTDTGGTPSSGQDVYYANCDDARAQGKAPVYSTDPGYRSALDSDSDGIGCEDETAQTVTTAQPTGQLAYTGFDTEGWLRLSAILVSGGTLILLAGVRRT